jgi:hypothetical protein
MKYMLISLLVITLLFNLFLLAKWMSLKSLNKKVDLPLQTVRPIARINIRTRGETHFEHMGTLTANDRVLPLYGRRLHRSSQKYNYYTTSDNYNAIKIPLVINGNECLGHYGCKEINDGDTISIPEYGSSFTVNLYPSQGLRYIPY